MEQKNINLPYLVLTEDGPTTLLVSAPDGLVLEFPIDDATAAKIDEVLTNSGLWSAFFTSLIQSMQNNEEHNPS
jgi:hypothetical protein